MPIETPILRVSRPVAACSRCRSAKTKCDGKLPACTACEKAGKASECSSISDEFARGKERSYVATLESRIERLEKKLAEVRQASAMGDDSMTTGDESRHSKLLKPAQKKEAGEMNELVSNFGLLSVNAAARDFHGFTSTMSYARLVMAAASRQPMPSNIARGLPERSEANSLIRYYFDHIFTFLPFFEETSFYTSLETVYRPLGAQTATPTDNWLVLMVLSISCISRSQQFNDRSYLDGMAYAASALQYQESILRPGSVTSIQAMMFLIEYSLYDPVHFDIWTLLGVVSRAMVDLGMHQDPPKSSNISRSKLEIRRRVYHCIYASDRYSSMAHGRSFSFNDDSTNVFLPPLAFDSPFQAQSTVWHPPNQDCWVGMVRLRRIQSSWYTHIHQSGLPPPTHPYSYIWLKFHETQKVSKAIMPTLPSHVRRLNDLEVLYSQIFLLAPSPWLPDVCELAQSLIFEYSIEFTRATLAALAEPASRIWLTCGTARRVQQVGRFFIGNLSNHQEHLLSGKVPRTEVSSGGNGGDPRGDTQPPRYPFPAHNDNLQRAADCITQLLEVFRILGSRFGVEAWQRQFELESRHILEVLT